MQTINESPNCDSIPSMSLHQTSFPCPSDLNLENIIDLNANLKPKSIKENPCPNKFNLTIFNDADEYLCIKRNDSRSDDKEEKESNESNKLSNESGAHSGTTMAESTFSPVTPTYKYYTNERCYYNNRKMSSPICCYYGSSHKAIAELLDKNLYDYSKSNNYIEKSFINPNENIYYSYRPMIQRPRMFSSIDFYEKREERKSPEIKEKEKNDTKMNHPVTPTIPLKLNTTTSLMNFSIFCNKQNNVNSVINSKSNNGNENTKNNNRQTNQGSTVKKHKPFTERAGDWVCSKCKNLNFAFRTMCNRCHLQKSESEKSGKNNTKFNNNSNTNKNN